MNSNNALIFLLSLCTASLSAGADPAIREAIQRDFPYLQSLYTDLHTHPEISFQEKNTSRRMAKELRKAGFRVTESVGGYGVVGVLENGAGPTVLLRTDMDALPIAEQTGLPYASRVQTIDDQGNKVPVMHACGHDIHMTVFTGTARRLHELRDRWHGTLVMIAQPAEERGAGARAMIGDGLFSRFPRPDYNLGLHVHSNLAAGAINYVPGYAMANVDSVDITVFGIGGHGAYPQMTKDPVVLAAQIINALQTLVSRELPPIEAGVVTVGSIHGGSKHNIIPDRVDMQLTVRSYTDAVREQLLTGIQRIALAQARSMGLPEDKLPVVKVKDEHTPALYNDPALTDRMVVALQRELGEDKISRTVAEMGGEDFAEYGRVEPRIPGVFLWLGSIAPERIRQARAQQNSLPSLHSPFYAPAPHPTIVTGVEALTTEALELLANTE
jgi:hippurate hydrolase